MCGIRRRGAACPRAMRACNTLGSLGARAPCERALVRRLVVRSRPRRAGLACRRCRWDSARPCRALHLTVAVGMGKMRASLAQHRTCEDLRTTSRVGETWRKHGMHRRCMGISKILGESMGCIGDAWGLKRFCIFCIFTYSSKRQTGNPILRTVRKMHFSCIFAFKAARLLLGHLLVQKARKVH